MARIRYTVTFPAARPGDEVTWPNTVKIYPDANTPVPLQSGQTLNESLAFSGWSESASVVFTRPAGDNDTVTVTSGAPSGSGAPSAPGGSGLVPLGWAMLTNSDGDTGDGNIALADASPTFLNVPFGEVVDSGGTGVSWDVATPAAVGLIPGWYSAYTTLYYNQQTDDIATAQYQVALELHDYATGNFPATPEPFNTVNPLVLRGAPPTGDPAFSVSWPLFRVDGDGIGIAVELKVRNTTSAPSIYSPELFVARIG